MHFLSGTHETGPSPQVKKSGARSDRYRCRKQSAGRKPGTVNFELTAHLVFVTKYRRKVFTAEMLDRCETIISDVAAPLDVGIMEINGEADHLHLLISYPPKVSISMVAGRLKGATSRRLRKNLALNCENSFGVTACGRIPTLLPPRAVPRWST